uniref:JmjC domain-containing protein n=1 Tax=Angiostrongylus cantonensis TaxID=6313 RepID=A0A0K0DB60_ANGCA
MEKHCLQSSALEICVVQTKLWWYSEHFLHLIGTQFSELRIAELSTDLITPNVLYEMANKCPRLQHLTLGMTILLSSASAPPNGLPPHRDWEMFVDVGLRCTAEEFMLLPGSPKLRSSPAFPLGNPAKIKPIPGSFTVLVSS